MTACTKDKGPPQETTPTFSLNGVQSADDKGSCVACHPRQFREWVGSSHNYGQALDPGYQSLEITGNYLAHFRFGRPVFRQNVLCVTCHAPSVGSYEKDANGLYRLNPNAQFRPNPQDKTVGRELRKPDNSEAVLEPPGRAAEFIADPSAGAMQIDDPVLSMGDLLKRRRISFQGITCETCHRTGRPFDDLEDDDPGAACHEKTAECAAMLRKQCEQKDDPRCRRITREQHGFDNPDRFDFGISNFALSYIRDGAMRFGPFPVGHVATNIGHDVSSGESALAQSYHVEFSGQPEDVRPYIKSSQFCGACHDVRLAADNLLTPQVEIEPIHNEPFIRLENLFTEFFISPLNLHPNADPRDNPFLDDKNNPIRLTCQDCHMSLFPFAPPRTFPGAYTANQMQCDDRGRCGSFAALQMAPVGPDGQVVNVTTNSLSVVRRDRVTTHYMTGVDIALGHLVPENERLGLDAGGLPASLQLPNQVPPENDSSPDYGLPISLDARREQQLKNAVHVNLAGTPELVDPSDRDCSDGVCCDSAGNCNLPVKVWVMNVNGGHNVAAGFSQERQVWVELTVQDMGRMGKSGMPKVVDCNLADIDDLYTAETTYQGRYPRWAQAPKPHDALEATDLFNRMYGVPTSTGGAEVPEEVRNANLCRGLSGHLVDKPHFETHELAPDGRLDDEDVGLHRIGNALPELEDGRYLISWHTLDYAVDRPIDAPEVTDRADRPDQFHTVGNRAYACELNRKDADPDSTRDPDRHSTFAAGVSHYPVVIYDPRAETTSTISLGGVHLKYAVTETADDRLEVLYPFPEFKPLLPRIDNGVLRPGARSGLVYPTNVFYRVCGCPEPDGSSCEGPKTIAESDAPAQVPWLKVWPTLPAKNTTRWPWYDQGALPAYSSLLGELGLPGGATSAEAFTFVPFNANHMPNNHSLAYFKPQRHYYDIRFKQSDVVGPLRVHAKVWYRHFPPEFLRLMARSTEQLYTRAGQIGKAADFFPNGPLMTEGKVAEMWPNAGHVDNLRRIMLDEAVSFVAVKPDQLATDPRLAPPDAPSFAQDVAPIIHDHCLPCHGDVLRHGKLVLAYDAFPQWDDPAQGPFVHKAQDPVANLVNKTSTFLTDRKLVVPGDPDASYLIDVLTKDKPDATNDRVRRMPLKMDPLSPHEIQIIRNWIRAGAGR